jgi:Tol biopolymer transport system component/DNA-binding winged helix-turn-helix (wHTH) protein
MSQGDIAPAGSEVRSAFRLGEITIEPSTGELCGPAGHTRLDPKVMSVLWHLARRQGQVVLREELLRAVWPGAVVTDDALSRCIYQLRRHLKEAAGNDTYKDLLETLPKRGYRLHCVPAPVAAERAPVAANAAASLRPSSSGRHRSRPWLLVGGVLILGSAMAVWFYDRASRLPDDPLAGAHVVPVTDFDGMEQDAAISRDGRLVAFLSDRDGAFDAWVTEIGSGKFRNLTRGGLTEARNPAVRTLTFAPDGTELMVWARLARAAPEEAQIDLLAVPVDGGPLRKYRAGVAEVEWSREATRTVYRTPAPGDPLFLAEANEQVGRQIFAGPVGSHSHFPVWSPDGAYVYFVYGQPPDDTDIWRLPTAGGERERITSHHARVTHPVFLDRRTLLYLAAAEDGSGPWMHVIDAELRSPRRIDFGALPYTSLSVSDDGRRVVATLTTPRTTLWRVELEADGVSSHVQPIDAPRGGFSPRLSPTHLVYRSAASGSVGLWRLDHDGPRELWGARRGDVVAGPAVTGDGQLVAFVVAIAGRNRLHVMSIDGTSVRPVAEDLDVRGSPAWSPDGRWIAIAADRGGGPQLFKIAVERGEPIPLVDDYSIDPMWSPDGEWLVYRGAESGPAFRLRAVTAAGAPHELPTIILPRGARATFMRARDARSREALVLLKGELQRKNFWLVDLATGTERQLTDFGPEFVIGDFDVAPDGREIVFDRVQDRSDVLLIELAEH